jgi:uncharacterized membrane protein YhaH (DUF805 family)
MTFTDAIRTCFTKYADFNGCASRSEFWWWALFSIVGSIVLGMFSSVLPWVFSLITLVPSIAVAARRLHDTDRSGWLQLIGLIPLVGWIIVLIWYAQDTRRPSRYADETVSVAAG